MSGAAYDSFNDTKAADAVSIAQSQQQWHGGTISQKFGAHSVVMLRFAHG